MEKSLWFSLREITNTRGFHCFLECRIITVHGLLFHPAIRINARSAFGMISRRLPLLEASWNPVCRFYTDAKC